MVPASFVMLDELPLTPNGKVDREVLMRGGGAEILAHERYERPRSPTEILIADIWSEALDVDRVGLRDNFFELGGHSLLAMRVASKVQEALGGRVQPLELLLQTLAQFAAMCDARAATGGEPDETGASLFGRLKRRLSRLVGKQ